MSEINWDALRASAVEAMQKSYSPYSNFAVGAAALTTDGRVVSGCNVENASYGVTLCAECSLVSNLMMTGGGKLVAFTCVDAKGNVLMPCGRCRQLIFEHGGNEALLMTPTGPEKMSAMLPWAFGPENLN